MEMMEWKEIILLVAQTLCYACTALVIPFVFKLLRERVDNDHLKKLIDLAEKTVAESVAMVQQTFVKILKDADDWDVVDMHEAFLRCKGNILELLNDEAKATIIMLHGDLDAWIDMMIEANVLRMKAKQT